MQINMKKWVESIMTQNKRVIIPLMAQKGIEILNCPMNEAVNNADILYKSAIEQDVKFPAEAICLIMDLSVEAEAFGALIQFAKDEIPSVKKRLLQSCNDIVDLQVPSLDVGRIPKYIDSAKLVSQHSTKPVFAGCIGPYSLAGRLLDISEIMLAIYLEPEKIKILLDKCTNYLIAYCLALKQVGANGVVMAEPAAGLLSNNLCSQFSSVYVKRIVQNVQDENFCVILHNCGNTGHCTKAMVETNAAALHFGNSVNMVDVLKECPKDTLVMGNLDPVALLKMSSFEDVYLATKKLLEDTTSFPNFILSSGCDCPYGVPDENIVQMYKALSDYNASL